MLHIIFTLLKIIGIILAAIIGLFLLLLLFVLFIPLRYRAFIKKGEQLNYHAQLSWFFGLVRLRILPDIGKKPRIIVKLIGFTLIDSSRPPKPKKHRKKKKSKHNSRGLEENKHIEIEKHLSEDASFDYKQQEDRIFEAVDQKEQNDESKQSVNIKMDIEQNEQHLIKSREQEQSLEMNETDYHASFETEECDSIEKKIEQKKSGLRKVFRWLFKKCHMILYKIGSIVSQGIQFLKKIFLFFKTFRDKIIALLEKIQGLKNKVDLILNFFRNEENKNGIKKVFTSLKGVLSHIRPRVIRGNLILGTGDPYTTGQVFSILGLLYSFYGKHLQLIPEWDQKKIEGELLVKGRIRLFTLLIIGIKLLRNENFRKLIKNGKKLKEEL